MNLLVAIAFWLVELPALCMSGRILVIGRQGWLELLFPHTLPFFFAFTEWTLSSITFSWSNYWLYFLFGLGALGENYWIGVTLESHEQPYASMNWQTDPQ